MRRLGWRQWLAMLALVVEVFFFVWLVLLWLFGPGAGPPLH
jgi:hypothetical protein